MREQPAFAYMAALKAHQCGKTDNDAMPAKATDAVKPPGGFAAHQWPLVAFSWYAVHDKHILACGKLRMCAGMRRRPHRCTCTCAHTDVPIQSHAHRKHPLTLLKVMAKFDMQHAAIIQRLTACCVWCLAWQQHPALSPEPLSAPTVCQPADAPDNHPPNLSWRACTRTGRRPWGIECTARQMIKHGGKLHIIMQ